MPPLTLEQLHEVTAQVGFAVWQIQILESTVGAYLVFVHKVDATTARREIEAMFEKAGKNTLGQLLRAIRATGSPPKNLVDQLDVFVPKRNWLVHHSRHESHAAMNSAQGRAGLIARIAAIADDALSLMKAYQAGTEAHLETLGITREQIDRDTAKLLREWGTAA